MSEPSNSPFPGRSAPSVAQRNTCLRSLCVYCPNLSEGREERAMDNVLFFYPPHTSPNAQMNHVGFCIGVTCLAERFAATGPVEEIRTVGGTIVLVSPFPDLWLALETGAAFGRSAAAPILRRGFDAFLCRHGPHVAKALVTPGKRGAPQRILQEFFDKFARFLESRVLLVDIRRAPNAPPDASLWQSRWDTVAGTEGLLAFAPSTRRLSDAALCMCHSIAIRHISRLDMRGGRGARCTGWGAEYSGEAKPLLDALRVRAEAQLLWTECSFVLFDAPTLRVVAATASPERMVLMETLLLVDPVVGDFGVFDVEDQRTASLDISSSSSSSLSTPTSRVCVSHADGILAVLILSAKLHVDLRAAVVMDTCTALAVDVAEYLRTGSCSITREGPISAESAQLVTLSPFNPQRQAAVAFASVPSHFKLLEMNMTLQWTVWNDGVVTGALMRQYPRAIHWVLSSILRAFIRTRTEGKGWSKDARVAVAPDEGPLSLFIDVPFGATEIWLPARDATWLCVMEHYGRICGAAFYNSATLASCFRAATELRQKMAVV